MFAVARMSAGRSTAESEERSEPPEEAQRRSRFLISASATLSESLDYERTLQRVAELSVPDIADWCTVTVVDEVGAARRLAVVHADPAKRELAAEYKMKFPPTEHRSGQMLDVLKRGAAALSVRVTDEDLVRAAQTEDHLRIMRGLGCASCVMVPMVVRGEILGVISLMRGEGRTPYGKSDVETAGELAHRAALAIDNARLYREARRREGTMRFFAEASTLLSSSLDHVSICERLAHLVVPSFADWCGVELAEGGSCVRSPSRTSTAPRSRSPVRCACATRPIAASAHGPHAVLRTGRAELIREVTEEMAVRGARNEEHLRFIRDLGLRSVLIVPLVAGGRPIGVLNLVWAESNRRYGPEDLEMMRELGRRAGLAVENARLYNEARAAVKLRDEFLSIASHELKTPAHQPAAEGGRNPAHHRQAREGACRSGQAHLARPGGRQAARTAHRAGRCAARRQPRRGRTAAAPAGGRRPRRGGRGGRRAVQGRPRLRRLLAVGGRDGAGGNEDRRFCGRWDRLRLDEVITNFLSNAIKYGAGKPIQIRVSATKTVATLEIEDHGIGISPDDQQRLFERFARVVSPEHYGGFGLGLWIVKLLVEAMGGKVAVRSAVGTGSVFSAELPRQGQGKGRAGPVIDSA